MVVVACCSGRKLRNATPYEILAIDADCVRVRAVELSAQGGLEEEDAEEESEPASEIRLSRQHFFRSMRLRYCLTYASVQGVTCRSLLALHDTEHAHFDRRKLFVGTSRAVASDLLVVY